MCGSRRPISPSHTLLVRHVSLLHVGLSEVWGVLRRLTACSVAIKQGNRIFFGPFLEGAFVTKRQAMIGSDSVPIWSSSSNLAIEQP